MYSVEFNNLSRCDGSAIMSLGETVLQAAVYGPVEIQISKELVDKAFVEVSFRPKVGMSGCAERLKEAHIKNSVEAAILTALHPRTSISVILQEIQDHGNSLSCSINAAILALLDGGIPMKCLVAAVTVAISDDGSVITFPTDKQQKEVKSVTISFESSEKNIVDVSSTGCFRENEFEKCLEACKLAVDDVFTFFRDSVKRRYSKTESCETSQGDS